MNYENINKQIDGSSICLFCVTLQLIVEILSSYFEINFLIIFASGKIYDF